VICVWVGHLPGLIVPKSMRSLLSPHYSRRSSSTAYFLLFRVSLRWYREGDLTHSRPSFPSSILFREVRSSDPTDGVETSFNDRNTTVQGLWSSFRSTLISVLADSSPLLRVGYCSAGSRASPSPVRALRSGSLFSVARCTLSFETVCL